MYNVDIETIKKHNPLLQIAHIVTYITSILSLNDITCVL